MATRVHPRRLRRLPARARRHQRRTGRTFGIETSDEWIMRAHRHPPAPHRGAARDRRLHGHRRGARGPASRAGIPGEAVDAIILATARRTRPSRPPRCACRRRWASTRGFGFDISAACAGFIYALSVADSMIRTGQARGALVIGSEVYLPHPELAGPRHLRAVRRRRRRGVPACRRGPAAMRPTAASSPPICTAQGTLRRHPVCRWRRSGERRRAGPSGDERARGVPPRGLQLAEAVDEALAANGLTQCRHRLAGAAPGQPADHRRDGQEARPAAGAGGGHGRPPRQYLGRLGAAGAGRGRWPTGGSSAATWC